MSKKLILFATHAEAEATLSHLQAEPLPSSLTALTCDLGTLVITGVGAHAAQHACTLFAPSHDEVISLGLAGALSDTLPLGTLATVSSVGKYTPLTDTPSFLRLPSFTFPMEGLHLVTTDFPIHDLTIRATLVAQMWDLVDMEGYGIAYAAHTLDKPCTLLRIVSDFAAPGGRTLIQTHLPQLSQQLMEALLCPIP